MTSKFISPGYATLNRALHETNDGYGGGYFADAKGTVQICRMVNATTFLDYGCGKGRLKAEVAKLAPDIRVYEYDPAIPGKEEPPPRTFPLVTCFDVLEHVEPEKLDAVISHIYDLCEVAAYIGVHNGPAEKTLADGRNAHLIQEPPEWWQAKFSDRFILKKGALLAEPETPEKVARSLFLWEKRS